MLELELFVSLGLKKSASWAFEDTICNINTWFDIRIRLSMRSGYMVMRSTRLLRWRGQTLRSIWSMRSNIAWLRSIRKACTKSGNLAIRIAGPTEIFRIPEFIPLTSVKSFYSDKCNKFLLNEQVRDFGNVCNDGCDLSCIDDVISSLKLLSTQLSKLTSF